MHDLIDLWDSNKHASNQEAFYYKICEDTDYAPEPIRELLTWNLVEAHPQPKRRK